MVPAVVSALADAGADLEVRTESGFTPLHVAAGISKDTRGGDRSGERRCRSGSED